MRHGIGHYFMGAPVRGNGPSYHELEERRADERNHELAEALKESNNKSGVNITVNINIGSGAPFEGTAIGDAVKSIINVVSDTYDKPIE